MIPKAAIEEAIEGGWVYIDHDDGGAENTADYIYDLLIDGNVFWKIMALDPSFWQSLGKALGWQGKHDPQTDMLVLQAHVHQFVDLILTGQSTDDFWTTLLTPLE